MTATLEFFFDYSSPYSYLASTRVEAIAQRAGATLIWRPFLLGAVFKATENVAPAANPYKARYLLKDVLDWTRHYGLPDFVLPDPFPMNSVKADRLGLVAAEAGKVAAFSHALFHAAFAKGEDVADAQVLRRALDKVGMDVEASLARADAPDIKDRLRAHVSEAVERGAYGAPTFFVGNEMFVGNDRLHFVEKALAR